MIVQDQLKKVDETGVEGVDVVYMYYVAGCLTRGSNTSMLSSPIDIITGPFQPYEWTSWDKVEPVGRYVCSTESS